MKLTVSLSNQELKKLDIVNRLIRKQINGTQAAQLLDLSVRQVKRLKVKVLILGQKSVAHASRGKIGHNRLADEERELIKSLLKEHYSDFGPTLATEKLFEIHQIKRNVKTIKEIMIEENLWTPRRKRKGIVPQHRSWRLRRANYGELIQFDGSYEYWFEGRWFEGRAEKCCLLAAIDDATGKVVYACFDKDEGVFPVFSFWYEYLLKMGKPTSIYLDKFSTYKMTQQVAINNHDLKTQFQRAMSDLCIEPIFANSPQAKGRVEKLFHTLQDRLIKELRLKNISDMKTANEFLVTEFLPNFNDRFGVLPRNSTNLHKSLTEKEKKRLPSIFSRQTKRIIQNDFTISFNNQWYQLLEKQPVTICKRDEVIVEERLDGQVYFCLRNKYLNAKPITKNREYANRKKQPWILVAG
ncbi:MAG: ISNCY family transposase [Patescibacteria group bacterium]